MTVPFVLPTVVVATAFLVLFRPGGALAFLGWQRGVAPMLVADVFFNVAVVVRTVGGFWATLDPRRTDAARVLGASRFRAFREVTLPLLGAVDRRRPRRSCSCSRSPSFGVVLLLADPAHATLEVEIYRQAVQLFDLPTAAALALVQIVAVLALLLVLARMQERRAVAQRLVGRGVTPPAGRAGSSGSWSRGDRRHDACSSAARCSCSRSSRCAWAGTGRSRRTARSARAARPRRCSSRPGTAVRNSLEFALIAAVIAIVVGGLASVVIASRPGRATRSMDTLLMLPLGTSAVTIGFGFLVALDRWPRRLPGQDVARSRSRRPWWRSRS